MSETKRFYSMAVEGDEATIDIYGDITSWPWLESDVSAYMLSRRIGELEVARINVNINSYGGEVAEGVAIYNALRRHPAQVVTRCDGMACSIASVIFMAGDERVMYPSSMLMIHNCWASATGNAAELRKAADDTEAINGMSKAAYLERVSITEDELTALMDAESWIGPEQAAEMGFATRVEAHGGADVPAQDGRGAAFALIMGAQEALRCLSGAGVGAQPRAGRAAVVREEAADPEPGPEPEPEPEPEPGPAQERGELRAEARALSSFLTTALA